MTEKVITRNFQDDKGMIARRICIPCDLRAVFITSEEKETFTLPLYLLRLYEKE